MNTGKYTKLEIFAKALQPGGSVLLISGDGECDIYGGHDGEAGTGHAHHHQRAEVCGKWYRYGKGDFL